MSAIVKSSSRKSRTGPPDTSHFSDLVDFQRHPTIALRAERDAQLVEFGLSRDDTVMGGYRLSGSRIHSHGAETACGRRGRY